LACKKRTVEKTPGGNPGGGVKNTGCPRVLICAEKGRGGDAAINSEQDGKAVLQASKKEDRVAQKKNLYGADPIRRRRRSVRPAAIAGIRSHKGINAKRIAATRKRERWSYPKKRPISLLVSV